MRGAWTMVLAMALALVACKGEDQEAPARPQGDGLAVEPGIPARPEGTPAVVVAMRQDLDAAGLEVKDVQPLPGHTMPAHCNEEWRYRVYFSAREFLNVNRFPDEQGATACFEEYRAAVAKGGQAAIDRLVPLNVVDGPYLFQFSESATDAKRRDAILAEVKKAARAGAAAPVAPSAPEQAE